MRPWFSKKQRPLASNFFLTLLFALAVNIAFAQSVDCSDPANCANAECSFAANIEKGCNCFDNTDNDGDGAIDKADGNCAAYYGLIFVGEGSDCSIVPPGSTDPFDLVDEPIMTAQNTADTQSKISVGDVDGDGIPDAVITSKWNSEIRVVATSSGQADGSDAGDIKADFKTTGQGAKIFSGTGGCTPQNLLFEHENLIADIDGDGKAELFGVVSNRGGNPSSPPTCFFLVGFKYKAGGLIPLWNAVAIGPDRPGTFGIADMDGDGKGELYIRDRIYAAETGALLATANGNWDLDVTSGPVAVNISGDTKMELVCGTKIYSIPSLSNRTIGTPAALTLLHDMNTIVPGVQCFVKLANDPVEYGVDTHSMCSVADIDRDGSMDVVISGALNSPTGRTAVFYWNVAKNTVSHALTPSSTDLGYGIGHPQYSNYLTGWVWGTGRVNLGDANGDGRTDLSFIAGSQLFCLTTDAAGTGLQTLWTQNLIAITGSPVANLGYREINDSRSGVLTVTIYDFNNDGDPEMAYRDSQELAVIDGATGTVKHWSSPCQSHTYTEGPVIADVNGDGATDVCVPCATAKFDIMDPIQQQALGQFRLYYSEGNEWLPTRKVWNQPGYFVVNIKDDLTLPFPQLDQNTVFSNEPCPNGTPGPQMPMNVFLNQVPFLSANGCPVFPAPDLSYNGDDPDSPGTDTNGDGIFSPTVEVIPPICGDLEIKARFHIINDGDLPITANIPVSFFHGDPTDPSITSDSLLFTTNINITNLAVGGTLSTPFVSFNGLGGAFRLYIVLNNDGSILPINPNGSSTTECRIDNNISSIYVDPDPFTTKIEKIQDNSKCANSAPNNGELRVRIFKGTVEQMDYSPYAFQWYTGPATSPVEIPGATSYNIAGLAEGDYSVRVTNILKGCMGDFVDTLIVRLGNDPDVTITKISDQTKCDPPDGALQASVVGGNLGYTFEWFDVALTPLGIVGANATNLKAGNYVVIVSKDGCSKNIAAPTILDPQVPDAQASVLQHVVDCLNPNSGSITADALLNAAPQDPANYTFEWYKYDLATSTRGSILSGTFGTGQTRTGLPAGGYQVIIKDNATQCVSLQTPFVEIVSQTVIPTAAITEVQPQTSCDPLQPNGILTATGAGAGLVSPNDFTFEWFKGDNTLPANLVTTVSGLNGETLNEVSGGGVFYTVRVTTANNCSGTSKLIISENVNEPVLTLTELTPNTVCDATKATTAYNGSIQATVTFAGNTVTLPDPNYTFTWFDGTTTATPHAPAPADLQNPVLTGLRDGNYAAVVERTDLFCASIPATVPVSKATVLPVLTATSTGSNNCDPGLTPDGTVTVTVTNVQAGDAFAYQWYAGNAVGVNPLGDANTGKTVTATKVGGPTNAPNQYTVLVTNLTTGCENNTTQFVADNSVVPVLSTTTAPNSICSPATNFNGSMTVGVTNIPSLYTIADYTFQWYDGNTTATLHNPQPSPATSVNLPGLDVGTYSVIGTNTKTGCVSALFTNQVANEKLIPVLAPTSIGSNNCVNDPANGINPDGSASVAVSVAAGPFNFQWYQGSGDPAALATLVPDAQGGKSANATGLGGPVGAPLPYTVLVTDQNTGCNSYVSISVADNSVVPVLSTSTNPNSICAPATSFNGSMTVSVTNIPTGYVIGDYEFEWYDGNTTTTLHSPQPSPATILTLPTLDAGMYSVIGTNTRTGCVSALFTNQVANNKILPVLDPSSTGSNNCINDPVNGVNPDGTASVGVTVAAGPFNYQWYEGSGDPATLATLVPDGQGGNTATASGLGGPVVPALTYTVLVTDQMTGCNTYTSVTVADVSVKPTFTLTPTPNHVCDITIPGAATQYDGFVTISGVTHPLLGSSNITYNWFNADPVTGVITGPNGASTGTVLSNLDNGNYAATVKIDALGCTSDPLVREVLDDLDLPVITTATTPNVNCYPAVAANGSAQVTDVDGLGVSTNYFYDWYNGVTATGGIVVSDAVLGLALEGPSNSYTVDVTNKTTGCKNVSSVTVVDAQVTPTITVNLDKNNTICDLGTYEPDGQLSAVVGSAGTNYTITWAGAAAPAIQAGVDGELYTKLAAGGPYTAFVTNDDTGCQSAVDAQNIIDDLTYPTISITEQPQTTCSGTPNGMLTATSVAGVVFTWFDGLGTGGVTHAQTAANSGIINQLAAADYTVRAVMDLTGCTSIQSQAVSNDITIPGVAFVGVNPVTKCVGPDGSATASITGLSAPNLYDIYYVYTSSLSGAAYPTDPDDVKNAVDPANHTYTSLTNQSAAPAPYGNMIPGYLTALVIDRNTLCESSPVTEQIIDMTVKSNISVTLTASPGICGTGFGGIDPTVTPLAATDYTYEWYAGTPTNTSPINFFTNPPTFATSQIYSDNGAGLGVDHSPIDNSISPGTFTLVVYDPDGCGTYKTDNVPTSTVPDLDISPTPITMCDNPNGSLDVQVLTGTSTGGYSLEIFSGNDNTGTSVGSIAFSPTGTVLSVSNLPEGPYFVELIDADNPTCPLGESTTLIKTVLPPLIAVNAIDPNTSCDPTITADGKVNLTVSNANGDVEPKEYHIFGISPLPVGFVLNPDPGNLIGNGDPGQSTGLLNGFEPQTTVPAYTITVRDDLSKCKADLVVSIPDQQSLPSALDLAINPETACEPLSNGSAIASLAGGESNTIFDFDWFKNNDATGSVTGAAPGDGLNTGGELLNQSKILLAADWPMGATGLGSGDRTYYVQGVKNATAPSGVGCKTGIVQVVIPDQHIAPDMALTPIFDSFCLATAGNNDAGDGQIQIVADGDPGAAGQNMPAGGFNYNWTPVPNASAITPPDNSSLAMYVIGDLHDGNYTVTATNVDNGCAVSNSVTIAPAPYVFTITQLEPVIDQRICYNDGWIQVKQVTLTDNSVGSPNSGTTADAAIDPLYTFQWYDNATLTAGTELEDGATTDIVTRTLSNDVDQDQTVNQPGDYQNMQAGAYYVIATRSDPTQIGFGCPSLPVRVDVADIHNNPIAQLTPFSNTSCLPGSDEGEIEINVSDATLTPFDGGAYTYTWDGANPTAIPAAPFPAANDGDGFGSGDTDLTPAIDNDEDHPKGLFHGIYNVTVMNNITGCSVLATTEVLENSTPVFVQNATPVDQILCAADGSITVNTVTLNDRDGNTQTFDTGSTPNISDFDFLWERDGIAFTQTTVGVPTLDVVNYDATGFGTDIGFGSYTVVAQRRAGSPGAGCKSAPYTVVIQDKRVFPVVTLTPFANTSCTNDPTALEGEISISVIDNSTAAGPAGLTYTWDVANPTAIPAAPFPAANDGDGFGSGDTDLTPAIDNDEDHPKGLGQGTYNMTVRSNKSNCPSIASTIILKNAAPVFIQNVDVLDQVLCSDDGSISVATVTVNDNKGNSQVSGTDFPMSDFEFVWTRNTIPATQTTPGSVLNATTYDATVFGVPLGFDSYTVTAHRISNGPGNDCYSEPFAVTIQDRRMFPVVSLTPLANTSCDPTFFEGEIKVNVIDNSTNLPAPFPGAPFNYSYDWTVSATPALLSGVVPGPHDGDGFGGGESDGVGADNDGDHPGGLMQGAYTVEVTNTQTGCVSTGTTTIFKNSTPVFTQLVVPTNQILCNPDGTLQVQEVRVIDRDGNIESNLNGDFALSDFVFSYDRATIGNTVVDGLHPAQPVTQFDNTVYASIGFDSYYVVATRVAGGPGLNCSSAPYKVDIEDRRLFPRVNFTALENSSCNTAKPNGTVVANASEQNGATTDPYTFSWTLDGGALAPTSIATDNSPSSTVTNALNGNYVVTVTNSNTGCPMDASFNLALDQTRSMPNIIDVSTIDPLDCNPSASATITRISIGGITNYNSPPDDLDAIFEYQWYKGDFTPSNLITGEDNHEIVGITADTYFVLVQDLTTDCQSSPKEVVINDDDIVYPEITIDQTQLQISCPASFGTGQLVALADGENDTNPDYTFSWFNNLDATGTSVASTSTLSDLIAGDYSVLATNLVTGCSSSDFFIIINEAEDFLPQLALSTEPRLNCLVPDGSLLAREVGFNPGSDYPFAPNYTTEIYTGANADISQPGTVMNNVPGFSLNWLTTGLDVVTYTVKITDNNTGCVVTAEKAVDDGRTPPVVMVVEDNPLINCDPLRPNGQLSATADDGKVGGYAFDWYLGATATGNILQSNNKLIGVTMGEYTVRVTNNITGCFADGIGTITDGHIDPPIPLAEVIRHNTHCKIPDGWVAASVNGVTLNYSFDWYDGTTKEGTPDFNGYNYTGRAPGFYTVTAMDVTTGCFSPPASVEVLDESIIPDLAFISYPSFCEDVPSEAGRGTGSLELSLIPAEVISDEVVWVKLQDPSPGSPGTPAGTGSYITGLYPGFYQAFVTTSKGCEADSIAEVKTEVLAYNLVTRNGDQKNDLFVVDCISRFPSNNVKIFNRSGVLVYEADGYNNNDVVFQGHGEKGVYATGNDLPAGTYFYIIDKRDGSKPKTGYLELVK